MAFGPLFGAFATLLLHEMKGRDADIFITQETKGVWK